MRCPDCNKFVSYDDSSEPEAELEVDEQTISGTVRIVLTCQDCDTELKEATFDIDSPWEGGEYHTGDEHELALNIVSTELTSRNTPARSPRYSKTFYGHSTEVEITCSCGKLEGVNETLEDDCQASGMEELV